MPRKKVIPDYSKMIKGGTEYYRTRITDADGKRVDIYGKTCEEVYEKVQAAQKTIAEAIFRRENPTVADYCKKWLLMKSATVRANTLEVISRRCSGTFSTTSETGSLTKSPLMI